MTGLFAAALLIAGAVIDIWPTADTRFTTVGGLLEVLAYVLFVAAGFYRSRRWFYALLLAPFSFWLWLLSLGH